MLIEDHLGKVSVIARLLSRNVRYSVEPQELEQVGVLAMIGAADRYKKDLGPFWPFVKMAVRGAMLDYLGRNWREACHVELSGVRVSGDDPGPRLEREFDIERALKKLRPRERRVFRAVREGHTSRHIAGMLRIDKARATRIRQRMESQMREFLVA